MKIHLARLVAAGLAIQIAGGDSVDAPWLLPRSMDAFQNLLDRSPFSLPTAEESAPLADRFSLTGAATIDGKPVVFVFDKNTQNRLMLGQSPDGSNNQLLDFQPDSDPQKMTARVRLEGQESVLRYAESAPAAQGMPQPPVAGNFPPQPGPPQAVPPGQVVTTNAQPAPNQPPRRVIRRRVISGQPPAPQPVPNQ